MSSEAAICSRDSATRSIVARDAMKTPAVLVLYDRPDELRQVLDARLAGISVTWATAPEEVVPALERARPEVVFTIKHSRFPGEAHRPAVSFSSVRWVQVGGSGYEHLAPWDASRVTVTNCHGVLAPFLAETVMAAIAALNAGLFAYRDRQRARAWEPTRFRSLAGQTLAVVGAGAIGTHVARLARAFGMRVEGVRRHAVPHFDFDAMHPPEALRAVLARADVVSVHVRATPETRRMFDREALNAMRPGALFVNTSRGAVVDEAALIDALQSRRLGAAYLDVFEREPLAPESPLWSMENVLITPHASDNVVDWPARFADVFADNLDRWRRGDPLGGVVSP